MKKRGLYTGLLQTVRRQDFAASVELRLFACVLGVDDQDSGYVSMIFRVADILVAVPAVDIHLLFFFSSS